MRVLLVEDSPTDAYITDDLLSLAYPDCKVELAQTLAEAGRLLDNQTFDFVLLDFHLPDANGIESVKTIRQQHGFAEALIILTGHEDLESASEALRQGADDYVTKNGLDEFQLRRAVSLAVERRQLWTQKEKLIGELKTALKEVAELRELLPICSACKRIRDDHDAWHHVEDYLHEQGVARFTHSMCPGCFSDLAAEIDRAKTTESQA